MKLRYLTIGLITIAAAFVLHNIVKAFILAGGFGHAVS